MIIDSNILVYALNPSSPKYAQSQIFLEENRSKLIITQQNIFETLRVITHSKFPHPFSSQRATQALGEIASAVKVIQPTLQTTAIALRLIEKYRISGSEIFDAYLVATALSYKISKIASDNTKHLQKYEEILVVNPFN